MVSSKSTGPDRTVQDILDQLCAGIDTEGAYRLLFHRYYRTVKNFFRGGGFPPTTCEDLAQETLLRAFAKIPTLRNRSKFEHWLFRIAKNVARSARRREWANRRRRQNAQPPGGDFRTSMQPFLGEAQHLRTPSEELIEKEKILALNEAIADLPDQMRQCVVLRAQHGLQYDEIAALLQISLDAVKVQLSRARKRLRKDLLARLGDITL